MKNSRFYVCERCGNVIGKIHDSGVSVVCCGQKMKNLEAGVVEASIEKHLPVVEVCENTVKVSVGAITHPMTEEHNISWIYLETDRGGQRKAISAGEAPEAVFALANEKPLAAYAYCNLHGLWKTEI